MKTKTCVLTLLVVAILVGLPRTQTICMEAVTLPDVGSLTQIDYSSFRASFEKARYEGDTETMATLVQEIIDDGLDSPMHPPCSAEMIILIPNRFYRLALDRFILKKSRHGLRIIVHDLREEVGLGTGMYDTEVETCTAIRDFLIDRYNDGKIRYLLIIGNHELIPMLPAVSVDRNTEYTYTDYFYADLDGDWDVDGDEVYGEMTDDMVDFVSPEFLVGRIPADDVQSARAALNRSIRYENIGAPEASSALLMSGTFMYEGDSGLIQDAVAFFLEQKGWETDHIGDTDIITIGDFDFPLGVDYLYDETSVPDLWNEARYPLVYNISHGGPDGVTGFTKDEISDLDIFPTGGYFVTASCASSQPLDGERNFSEELMLEGKVIGVVGATNAVYPGIDATQLILGRSISGVWAELSFPMAITQVDLPVSQAIQIIKGLYYGLFVQFETDPDWLEKFGQNLNSYTLYGDPSAIPVRSGRREFNR